MGDNTKGLVFRLGDDGDGPPLIRQVFLSKGWREWKPPMSASRVDLHWRALRFRETELRASHHRQRLNHYTKSVAFTRKDTLFRMLQQMKNTYGSIFDIFPLTFAMPNGFSKFSAHFSEVTSGGDKKSFICKPADLSRGRKVFVFKNIHELSYDCPAVVQEYIDRPLLIHGYKFDLRLYVAVYSWAPLRAYIHTNGLARFASAKYDPKDISNSFSHLTNVSINKSSPAWNEDKSGIGTGGKWSLEYLWEYLSAEGIDSTMIWNRVKEICMLTLVASLPVTAPSESQEHNCFELYGFDIMFDEDLRAFLLEVNFSPAMSLDGEVDREVKPGMISDLIDMAMTPPPRVPVQATYEKIWKDLPPSYNGFEIIFPFNPDSAAASLHVDPKNPQLRPLVTLAREFHKTTFKGTSLPALRKAPKPQVACIKRSALPPSGKRWV